MRLQTNDREHVHESTGKEDMLVPDTRSRLTPAQMVERKLLSLLKSAALPASRLQAIRRRCPR